MASLFGSAILSACMGLQGNYYEACSKAMDAGTRQIGLRQQADDIEHKLNDWSRDQAQRYMGNEFMGVVGFVGFGVKTYREQRVAFKIPNLGMCSSINSEVGRTQQTIKFQWNF